MIKHGLMALRERGRAVVRGHSRGAAIFLAIAGLVAVSGVAGAQSSPGDYTYRIPIEITNETGADLESALIPFEINAGNLVGAGYVQDNGRDVLFTGSNNRSIPGMAHDLESNPATWWVVPPKLVDEQTTLAYIYIGNDADNDFGFAVGPADAVSVPDANSLDIADNLTLEVSARLHSIPTASAWQPLLHKADAYGLQIGNTNTARARITRMITEILRPNTDNQGIETQFPNTGAHWDKIDEATADGDTTYVSESRTTLSSYRGSYGLTNTNLTGSSTISHVNVTFLCRSVAHPGIGQPSLNIGSSTVFGIARSCPVSDTYSSHTQTLAKPGGGSWTASNLNVLKAGFALGVSSSGGSVRVTQVYATIYYRAATGWVDVSGLTTDTDYRFTMTYADPTLTLAVTGGSGGSATADMSLPGLPPTTKIWRRNSSPVLTDNVHAYVTRARIGDTSLTSPTWKLDLQFEPNQITETDAGDTDDGWTWEGTIADQSDEGNDASYTTTRDPTDISVDVGVLELFDEGLSTTAASAAPDIFGEADPSELVTTSGERVPSPFMDSIRVAAESSLMGSEAWALLIVIVIGNAVVGWTVRATDSMAIGAGAGAVPIILFCMTAFLAWWVLVFYLVWALSFVTVHELAT